MNYSKLSWHILAFASYSAILHESIHALVALAFGYKILGVHFGFPWSYVLLSNSNFWVYLSGGLGNAISLLVIWKFGRNNFTAKEQTLIFSGMIFEFVYSLWEGFVYPRL